MCDICYYAKQHACLPPNHQGSHCRTSKTAGVEGCCRSWTGKLEQHCVICHGHFSSIHAADAHRVGNKCRPPATLRRKSGEPLFRAKESPFGVTWVLSDSRETPWGDIERAQDDEQVA